MLALWKDILLFFSYNYLRKNY